MKLTMKSNEYFQGFYLNGKPFYGRKHDDDIVFLLEELAKHCGFKFNYDGNLSEPEMDKDFR